MNHAPLLDIAAKLSDERELSPPEARRIVAAIEAGRAAGGLSQEEMTRLAGVSISTWRYYRAGTRAPTSRALRKLARVLLRREDQAARDATLMQALAIRALEDMARASDPKRARKIAIYLAHVELGLPQKRLARLYGCSGNYINMVVQGIEAGRDDGTPLDVALLKIGQRLGEGAGAFMRGAA